MSEKSHRGIVDVKSARVVLSGILLPLETEQAGLINAFGRTLAQELVTELPVPPHNLAAKDGYAVFAADTAGATSQRPRTVSILSSSKAIGKSLERGTGILVRKHDPLPECADAVIDISDTYRPEDGAQVLALAEATPGDNVIAQGSISPPGLTLLPQGAHIGPCEMEVIAALGTHGVAVRRRPRISIITSGAEIVDGFGELSLGESRNSARYGLVGMVLGAGCDLGRLIHVRDGRIGIQRALGECSGSDAVIVSIGPTEKHDISLEAISTAGTCYFSRLQLHPANCGFGVAQGRPVFAIENRHALELFEAIIRPGLMMLLGRQEIDRPCIAARLDSTLKLDRGCPHYVRAVTSLQDGQNVAKPANHQAVPNSLIIVSVEEGIAKRGDIVEVILLS